MNETMILPITTSPPPAQAVKPAETGVSSGPSFEEVLRAQTEIADSKPASPARPTQKDSARPSSTEEAKANPPADDQPVEKPKDTKPTAAEDPAATAVAASAAAAMQQVSQPVQPVAIQPDLTQPAIELAVETATDQGKQVPVQLAQTAAQAVQPAQQAETNPAAPAETTDFAAQLQSATAELAPEVQAQAVQTVPQPVKPQTAEPVHEQIKADAAPKPAEKSDQPQVKVETTPTSGEPKTDVKVEIPTTPAAAKPIHTETAKPAVVKTETSSAAGEQEAPKQVQAPPGNTHPEVTGLEVKTTAAPQQFTEPARLAEAQTSDMIGQITRQMDQMSQSGRTTIRMQLNPHELGQIDLKITTTPQGVGVTILAENASTGKLLETQVAQLRQTLMDAGVQISNLQVGTQTAQQQSFAQQNSQPGNKYNTYRSGSETSEPETVREVRRTSSLVDYSV